LPSPSLSPEFWLSRADILGVIFFATACLPITNVAHGHRRTPSLWNGTSKGFCLSYGS
jgi:hypothetical protein